MNNDLKLILSTFTRQRSANDCGMACLLSVCSYVGVQATLGITGGSGQLSLLELRTLAAQAGLASCCVRMDMAALSACPFPCILHVVNDSGQPHYIVHYPYRVGALHLVGDPDRQVELATEDMLRKRWVSGAALYFEDANPASARGTLFFPWRALAGFSMVPRALWFIIPLFNLAAVLLGMVVTLVIQKGADERFIHCGKGYHTFLFILLAFLLSARCGLQYFGKHLLMMLAEVVGKRLSPLLIRKAYQEFSCSSGWAGSFYQDAIRTVQQFGQAAALLIGGIFSDGLLLMVMLGSICYLLPWLACLLLPVFLLMLLVTDHYLPLLMIYGHFSQFPARTGGYSEVAGTQQEKLSFRYFVEEYECFSAAVSTQQKQLSALTRKVELAYEGIHAMSLIAVLVLTLQRLQEGVISYEEFLVAVVMGYGILLLMTKICQQFFVVAIGAESMQRRMATRTIY